MKSGVYAVIIILVLISFSGCIESNDDDKTQAKYWCIYSIELWPQIENGNFSIILPAPINRTSNETTLDPPLGPLNWGLGNGSYQYVMSEKGFGLQIESDQHIILAKGIEVKYNPDETLFEKYPLATLSLQENKTNETISFWIFLDNSSETGVSLHRVYLHSVFDYPSHYHDMSYTIENGYIGRGWNLITTPYYSEV